LIFVGGAGAEGVVVVAVVVVVPGAVVVVAVVVVVVVLDVVVLTALTSHHLRVPKTGSPKTLLLQSTPSVNVRGLVKVPFAP
jgi:hypothetical protein